MGGGQAKQPPVARRRPDPVQRRARRIRECGGTELHAFGPSRRARCGDHHSGFFINGTAAGPGGDPLGGLHGFGGERVKETGQPPGGQVSLQRQDGRAGTVQGRREALQQPPARFLRGQHNRVQRTIYHARKVRSCENGPGLTVTADPAVTNVSRILTVEGARVVGLETLLGSLRAFAIPMTTKFRGITVREGALIEGPAGWGEFSPFAEYGPRESARWLASAVEAAGTGWPAAVRDRVPVNVTVPAVGPARAYEIAASSGCRTAKVKVAERDQTDADDIARVEAVRDALGPDGRVRIDVNGRWDVAHATRMLAALAPFGLEYAEQPCMTLDEMAELRRAHGCSARGRRVDQEGRGPDAGPRRRGRQRGRAQGPAARRGPRGAADRRGVRPAGRGVQRGRHVHRPGRGPGAGRRAAGPAVRLRARHDEPAGGGRHRGPPGPGGGRTAGAAPCRRPGRAVAVGGGPGGLARPGHGRGGVPGRGRA